MLLISDTSSIYASHIYVYIHTYTYVYVVYVEEFVDSRGTCLAEDNSRIYAQIVTRGQKSFPYMARSRKIIPSFYDDPFCLYLQFLVINVSLHKETIIVIVFLI